MINTQIRYLFNKEIRSIWDNKTNKFWYSATDVVFAITKSKNPRIYWNALKRRHKEIKSFVKQLEISANDGKLYISDVINEKGISKLRFIIHKAKNKEFDAWIDNSLNPRGEQCKSKAYELYSTGLINFEDIGKTISLKKIHSYVFEGLYEFAGKVRTTPLKSGRFEFINNADLIEYFKKIDNMEEGSFDNIVDKYILMNIVHPFYDGNGRATRMWLDLMLIKNLGKYVNWSKINKEDYHDAMKKSVTNDIKLKKLIKSALISNINDISLFKKGIDASFSFEE